MDLFVTSRHENATPLNIIGLTKWLVAQFEWHVILWLASVTWEIFKMMYVLER